MSPEPSRPGALDGVRSVLCVRLDNVGDVLLLGPATRAIREALPAARITLFASPAGTRAAPLLPEVDDVITWRAAWQDASGAMPVDPERELELVSRLRAGSFDAALIFTSFSQSPYPAAYACYLAGIPVRVGMAPDFGGSLLTAWVRSPDSALHQADRNLYLLEALGVHAHDRSLAVSVPVADRDVADALLRDAGVDPAAPFVVVAPGASCPARRYDAGRFADAAGEVSARTGHPVVVVGSDAETELAEGVVARAATRGRVVSLAGRTTVPQLAAVIERCALLIANDSGPMHLADALRRPSVILYAGTELESQWQPRSAPAVLLRRPTPCSPCHRFTCPFSMECLDIPASDVVGAALDVLGHLPQQPRPPRRARSITRGTTSDHAVVAR